LQALPQAGPPLITNDPDTPGDGNWEINLAATGTHGDGGWQLAAPDVDINYGLGERLQLSVHLPWNHQRLADGEPWQSGAGPVEFALRWRFVDEDAHGFSMAIQPHWSTSWSNAAQRQGLAPANDEFALPLQVSTHAGKAVVGAELGRNFIAHERDEWQAGVFWSRQCARSLQCLAEVNSVWSAGAAGTVVNLGFRRSLGAQANLLASLGRSVGGADRGTTIFYLGVQLLRSAR
jgi:hypothetical protein